MGYHRLLDKEKGSCLFATPFQNLPVMLAVNSFSFKPTIYLFRIFNDKPF